MPDLTQSTPNTPSVGGGNPPFPNTVAALAGNTIPTDTAQPDFTKIGNPLPMTTTSIGTNNKENKLSGKLIPTILGLLLLIGGIGAGVFLVQQRQEIREKANTGTETVFKCYAVKAYDTDWNLLTSSDLNSLAAGDVVRFTISGEASSGEIDKAKFSINGVSTPEVTSKKPGTDEFYYEYTIPTATDSFTVGADIHSTSYGWLTP
jgi:hypothetical protein